MNKERNFNGALDRLYKQYPLLVSLIRFCVCFTLFVLGKVLLKWMDGKDTLTLEDLLLQPVMVSIVFVVLFALHSRFSKQVDN